ncbi:hypothetical protein JCM6882_003644 [Rhodosporidiobolus microsporus]
MPPKSSQDTPVDDSRSAPPSASSSSAPLPALDSTRPAPSPQDHPATSHAPPHAVLPGFYDPRLVQPFPGYPFAPPGFPFAGYPPPAPSLTAPLPGAASSSATDSPAQKKRARTETPAAQGADDDDGDDASGTRKKRLPLSCGECQRRKIKCDRKVPCGACVRRKRTDYCTFDDDDPVTPYALNSEVRAIQRRLAHLESLFHQHAPHIFSSSSGGHGVGAPGSSAASVHHPSPVASTSSHPSPALPSHHSNSASASASASYTSPAGLNGSAAGGAAPPAGPSNGGGGGDDDEDMKQPMSDTEDAVADLEEKTFEARVPVLQALHAAAEQNVKRYNYVKVVDMELTSALTSILAEPLSFDQDGRPRSAVRLGLDLAVSTHDLPAVRRDALAQIFAVLPDEEIAKFLIQKYFDEIEWDFRCLDPVAFPVEHARFVAMKHQGREDLIDPLWIAVFSMVLALSLEAFWSRPHGRRDMALFRGLPEADLRELPSVWHDAALRALQIGEWGGTPRIRTIQATILMQQYIQISSTSGQQGRILGWVASAIRVAQRLGLHRLGAAPDRMPPDDPALPPGRNSVKRETAVRLWWQLVCVDSWLSDSQGLRCYLLHPSQYNTALPLNLNFRDLSRTDWRLPAAQPLTVYTDASFELVQIKIAEQIRRTLDTLVISGNGFSYPAVLEQDKLFRAVLEDVPDVFSEKNVPIDSARIIYQRACLHEDVFSRIVRLNRPLLGRGYAPNSPYRYSTEQCIEAAKAVILSNHRLLQVENSRWWMYTGTLASSFVVMMDLFHWLDHDASENEIKEKRDVLLKAREIFDSQVATPALTVVVEEGRKLLAALFVEEERRRTTKAAHSMASAPPPSLEPFAQVLKRVSREIASKEQPIPVTLVHSAALNRPLYPSSTSLVPPPPPFSFAQAAATAMANTPTSFDPLTSPHPQPHSFGTPPTATLPPLSQDFSSFFSGVANSEDWIAGFGGSPGGDESALLDQLAATW